MAKASPTRPRKGTRATAVDSEQLDHANQMLSETLNLLAEAAKALNGVNEVLGAIEKSGDTAAARLLAEVGKHYAFDMGNYIECEHERLEQAFAEATAPQLEGEPA